MDLTSDGTWEINFTDVEEITSTETDDDFSEEDMNDPDMMTYIQDCYKAY